ncbi:MAG: thioredoxin domain-containing protein [Microbacterium sp.]
MSSDETPNVPAPSSSREAVREKAQQVHAKQSRARLARRVIIGAVAVLAVGAIGSAVAWAVGSSVSKPLLNPKGMDGDGVVVHEVTRAEQQQGAPDGTPSPDASGAGQTATPTPAPEPTAAGTVDIHIYVDYLSPGSGDFERANARQLSGWISEGAVSVTYHPVALLNASSNGTKYSLRSAAAAACVASFAPDHFYAYNHELLTTQPKVDTDGPTDVELADLAGAVGVGSVKQVRSCIEEGDYVSWAKEATARALKGPLPGTKDLVLDGTPMVIVNGQTYVGSMKDPAEFSQFVLTVASDAYYGTPTPTPTPETSETPTP